MNHKILRIVLCCLVGLLFLGAGFAPILSATRRMKTLDTFGKIEVTLDQTLTPEKWRAGYSFEVEMGKIFPQVPIVNGKVHDAWSHPISVIVNVVGNSFSVTVLSPGPDGQPGTKDDLIKEFTLESTKRSAPHNGKL